MCTLQDNVGLRANVTYRGDVVEKRETVAVTAEHRNEAIRFLTKRVPSKKAMAEKLLVMLPHISVYTKFHRKLALLHIQKAATLDLATVEKEARKIAVHRHSFKQHECLYVGRPSNANQGYCVPAFGKGSPFANPFPVTSTCLLETSLSNFAHYLKERLLVQRVEELCAVVTFPERIQGYITKRTGKQYDYLRLTGEDALMGVSFKVALLALDGKRLGCFCELSSDCHVDVLLKTIAQLKRDERIPTKPIKRKLLHILRKSSKCGPISKDDAMKRKRKRKM
jgi:hypothetical protein